MPKGILQAAGGRLATVCPLMCCLSHRLLCDKTPPGSY
ncbi:hypothetical protein GBAR_LOCUS29543, partial [Geodia barretti]